MTLEQTLVTILTHLTQLSTPEFLTILVATNAAALLTGLGIGKMFNIFRGL